MTLSTTALAHYDAPKLAAALQRAKARIQELEKENNALHNEIRWIDRLLAVPTSVMSPSHKVTLRAAVKAYQQGTPDEHGMEQIESCLNEKNSLANQGSQLDYVMNRQVDLAETAKVEKSQEPATYTNVNLTPIKTTDLEHQLDDSAAIDQQEPPTPQVSDGAGHYERHQGREHLCSKDALSQADLLTHAAQLLVEIAGPEPVHIEMSGRGPKKYYDVKRAITEQDAYAHLKGWKTNGQSAARVLLIYQTCADLVLENVEQQDVPQQSDSLACSSAQTVTGTPCGSSDGHTSHPITVQHEKRTSCTLHIASGVDHRWQQKYSQHLWFHFTPAQLADWYNVRNRVENILPQEKNGMGLASWRGEQTPSVGLREDGWVDFGASARRGNGKQDGGDALELTVRVNEEAKPEVMRELARQLVGEAREAVESAAYCGEEPPQWVQVFMSSAGWEHYHQLREEAGYSDKAITEQALSIGGVAGRYSPDDDAPANQADNNHGQRQLRESSQAVSAKMNGTHDNLEAFAVEINAAIGEPCQQCACTLSYWSGEHRMCHWCFPCPAKFGRLSDEQWARLRVLLRRG